MIWIDRPAGSFDPAKVPAREMRATQAVAAAYQALDEAQHCEPLESSRPSQVKRLVSEVDQIAQRLAVKPTGLVTYDSRSSVGGSRECRLAILRAQRALADAEDYLAMAAQSK